MSNKIENDDLNFEKDEPILEKTTNKELEELFKPKVNTKDSKNTSCVPSGEQITEPTVKTTEPKQNPSGGQSVSPSPQKNDDTKLTQEEILATIGKQVEILFEPNDIVEIIPLNGSKAGDVRGMYAKDLVVEFEKWMDSVKGKYLFYPWSLYWGINPRRGLSENELKGDNNVILARCLFVDFDLKDFQKINPNIDFEGMWKIIKERIKKYKLTTPSIIGMSGHGCHLYWRLDIPITDLSLWTSYQKKLIKILGSDEKICDPQRIMRILGTPNNKTKNEGSNCGVLTKMMGSKNIVSIESFGFDKITLDFGVPPSSKDKADNQPTVQPNKQQISVGVGDNKTPLVAGQIKLYNSATKQTVIIDTPTDDMILCPFHNEKSPSCSVDMSKKIFQCFGKGCGAKGKIFDYNDDQKFWEENKPIVIEPLNEDIAKYQYDFLHNPIDITEVYNQSPLEVKKLTQLMYIANRQINPTLHYFMAWGIIAGLIGKKLTLVSGRNYYPVFNCVGFVDTNKGKTGFTTIIKKIEEVSGEGDFTYKLMGTRFTTTSLYGEMGGQIKADKWNVMDDNQKIYAKREIAEKCKKNKSRFILSDEMGNELKKMGYSGQVGAEETGAILKMLDSPSYLDGTTAKDGCRYYDDGCISFLGYSQKSTWQDDYDFYKGLYSGFTGRWLLIDQNDYVLNMPKCDIAEYNGLKSRDIEKRIKTYLSELSQRFATMPSVYDDFPYVDEDDGAEIIRDSYNELISENHYDYFGMGENSFLTLLGAKQKMLAMKFSAIDKLLRMGEITIPTNDCIKEDNDEEENGEMLVDLHNKAAVKRYLNIFIANSIKIFASKSPRSEWEKIKNNLLLKLKNEKTHEFKLSKIGSFNLPYTAEYKNHTLTSKDAMPILEEMQDEGLINLIPQNRKDSIMIRINNKGLTNANNIKKMA